MGLGFGVCALAGEIVRCLQVMGRARARDVLAPTGKRHVPGAVLGLVDAYGLLGLSSCAKGVERAFDEGFARRAHHAGKGCDLV